MPTNPKAGGKKSAAKKKEKPVIVTEQIQAPYVFTPDEIMEMGTQMRGHMTSIDELTAQMKQSAADFKLRIGSHTNSVQQLRNKCDSGQETRPMEAVVKFNHPKKGEKTFIHPETKEEIRSEPMTPADWQLPMFKPAPDGKGEVVAPKGATDVLSPGEESAKKKAGKGKKAPAEPGDNAGKTPLGAALNAAAGTTETPRVDFYMDEIDDETKLVGGFKKAAKKAGWKAAQISALDDALKSAEGIDAMKDVLRPHIVENPSEQPQ
jgi:hypothetical protein